MTDRETVQNMWNFIPKNKFEKLVHLVGFIIRICHDVWSFECQTYHCSLILWDVAQCQWVVCYKPTSTAYRSHLRLQIGLEESFLPMWWNSISVLFQVARMSMKIHSYILGECINPISSRKNVCDEPFLHFGTAYQSDCIGWGVQEEWFLPTIWDSLARVEMSKKNHSYQPSGTGY